LKSSPLPAASHRVVAVVVSYNPDADAFANLLDALLPQVAYTVVVDNASSEATRPSLDRWPGRNIEILQLPENFGIAAAQNAGIVRAMELGADSIFLSDQDSVPSASLVTELLATLTSANEVPGTAPVAAVGPATVDKRTGRVSFFVVDHSGIPSRWQPKGDSASAFPPCIEVRFLIASGTLIPIDVINQIGAMRSNYFIDHVDTEWCFRAQAAGYRLLGVPAARLEHQLGDAVRQVWFFGYRQVMYHSPLRDYYMFRNTLLMSRDTKMPWIWRLYFMWRLLQFAAYFLFFAENRYHRFRYMALGLVHGFFGLSGRLDVMGRRCSAVPFSDIEP